MTQTKIEWVDYSWNPTSGCTPVSEGCQNCYARRMANRLRGRFGYPEDEPFRVTLHSAKLKEPLRWKKPRRVFVCSMGDLFHPDVPFEFIVAVFRVMTKCAQHTFMILTKRPNRVKAFYVQSSVSAPWAQKVCENIWVGVTAENQQAADERIPILLQIPAAVRFVSCEPLLGPVDLELYLPYTSSRYKEDWHRNGYHVLRLSKGINQGTLDWVICGGETGPGARPMHPDWVRSLRDQAVDADVPFFFKSWGEYIPSYEAGEHSNERCQYNRTIGECWVKSSYSFHDGQVMVKVGKKAAGRLLDGREWDEVPEVPA